MILRSIAILLVVISCSSAIAQETKVNGERVERIFRNRDDSSHNFYLVLEPKSKPSGLILILPGYGSYPRAILYGSDLPSKARKKGFVVVIPYLGDDTFYVDSIARANLRTLVPEVLEKYGVSPDRFVIGGHSAGGNAALLYAADSFRDPSKDLPQPAAAFGIDPPLDLARFRNTVMHEISIEYRKENIAGMKRFLSFLDSLHGGSPTERPANYQRSSAYSRIASQGGNTKFLGGLPLRLYCDPDVNWALRNLAVGFEHLNASDLSACIAQLKLLGNDRSELIVNIGKGYIGKDRNPHGLSQLDSREFLKWLEKVLR